MRLKHLLLIAICVHLVATCSVFLAGRWAVAPSKISNDGISSFASDSNVYLLQIKELQTTLKNEGVLAWLRTPAPVHVKLYAVSYALFSPLFGQNILSAEPLNLIYYLATLLLIFALGREAFGDKEALLAAGMCAILLPSFLMHTTQLLKDPLFVVLALGLILVSVKWTTTEYALRKGLCMGALGGMAAASIWLVKDSVWWLILAIMFMGVAFSVARQARIGKVIAGNIAGMIVMAAIALSVSHFVKPYLLPKEYWTPHQPRVDGASLPDTNNDDAAASSTSAVKPGEVTSESKRPASLWSRVPDRIARKRALFIELYPDAASNIDAGVKFSSAWDVVRYLPRAMLIGLCAPFPNMWLDAGRGSGRIGRLVSGGETLLMCLVEVLALQGLWHRRRQLPVWLLMLTSLMGVIALGLVVVNIGALYRQRYLFWILFMIVAADPVVRLFRSRFARELKTQRG